MRLSADKTNHKYAPRPLQIEIVRDPKDVESRQVADCLPAARLKGPIVKRHKFDLDSNCCKHCQG